MCTGGLNKTSPTAVAVQQHRQHQQQRLSGKDLNLLGREITPLSVRSDNEDDDLNRKKKVGGPESTTTKTENDSDVKQQLHQQPSENNSKKRKTTATTKTTTKSKSKASSPRTAKNHPRLVVHHHYHDHAADPMPVVDHYTTLARTGANTAFPLKLYDMLERIEQHGEDDKDSEDEDREDKEDDREEKEQDENENEEDKKDDDDEEDVDLKSVVSWQPHGRCFVVHRPDKFKEMLPQYFKLSKIASFQRQLNLYGFVRISSGPDKNGYYHELFLRGRPFLIEKMNRSKVKGTKVRAKSNPAEEPDFWNMSWIGLDGTVIRPANPAASSKATDKDTSHHTTTTTSSADDSMPPLQRVSSSQSVMVSRGSSSSIVSHEDFDDDDRDEQRDGDANRPKKKARYSSTGYGDGDSFEDDIPVDDDAYDPIPITPSSSAQNCSSSSAFACVPDDHHQDDDDDDVIMTGWGMKFHYLGSLPDEVVHSHSSCYFTNASAGAVTPSYLVSSSSSATATAAALAWQQQLLLLQQQEGQQSLPSPDDVTSSMQTAPDAVTSLAIAADIPTEGEFKKYDDFIEQVLDNFRHDDDVVEEEDDDEDTSSSGDGSGHCSNVVAL